MCLLPQINKKFFPQFKLISQLKKQCYSQNLFSCLLSSEYLGNQVHRYFTVNIVHKTQGYRCKLIRWHIFHNSNLSLSNREIKRSVCNFLTVKTLEENHLNLFKARRVKNWRFQLILAIKLNIIKLNLPEL